MLGHRAIFSLDPPLSDADDRGNFHGGFLLGGVCVCG